MDYINIVKNKIDNLLKNKENIIIAIDGDSASGKTTLALSLKSIYKDKLAIIHIDDFYLENKGNIDMNNISSLYDGNINYKRLKEEVIDKLLDKNISSFSYLVFNCKTQKYNDEKERINKKENKIILVEGSYSQNIDKLGKYFDYSIFLKFDDDTLQKERIKKRNASNFEMFFKKRIILEKNYQAHYDIVEKCDFLINVSGYNS